MDKRWDFSRKKERQLYKRAIELLTEAFVHAGVTPTIGVEFEFHVFDKDKPWEEEPLRDINLEKMQRALQRDLAGLLPALAFDGQPVHRLHKEDAQQKYEVSTSPFYADLAADAVDKVKAATLGRIHRGGNYKTTTNPIAEDNIIPGLHTTMGLINGDKDAFIGRSSLNGADKALALAHHMKPALRDLVLLFAPKPISYDRYRYDSDTTPKHIAAGECKNNMAIRVRRTWHTDGEAGQEPYISQNIENRIPGADTPAYKAILGTMLAAYDAFDRIAVRDDNGKTVFNTKKRMTYHEDRVYPYPPDHELPDTMEEAAQHFLNSKKLWEKLDQLAPEEKIGSQIFKHELSRYRYIETMQGVGKRREFEPSLAR